ncbi:hypothetical protein VPHK367G1_0055 [Vibrio phage K367 g1]
MRGLFICCATGQRLVIPRQRDTKTNTLRHTSRQQLAVDCHSRAFQQSRSLTPRR